MNLILFHRSTERTPTLVVLNNNAGKTFLISDKINSQSLFYFYSYSLISVTRLPIITIKVKSKILLWAFSSSVKFEAAASTAAAIHQGVAESLTPL